MPGFVFKSSNQGRNSVARSVKRKSSENGPPSKRQNSATCSTPRPESRPVPKPQAPEEAEPEAAEPSTFEKLQSIEDILQDLRDRKSDKSGMIFRSVL